MSAAATSYQRSPAQVEDRAQHRTDDDQTRHHRRVAVGPTRQAGGGQSSEQGKDDAADRPDEEGWTR
jgi:hypothetical protein